MFPFLIIVISAVIPIIKAIKANTGHPLMYKDNNFAHPFYFFQPHFLSVSVYISPTSTRHVIIHAVRLVPVSWRRAVYPGMRGPCISPGHSRSWTVCKFLPSVPGLPKLSPVHDSPSLLSWTGSGSSRRCKGCVFLPRTWRSGSVPHQPCEHKGPQTHQLSEEHELTQRLRTLFGPHLGTERTHSRHSIHAGTCEGRERGEGSRDYWGLYQVGLFGSPYLGKGPQGACASRAGSLRWQGDWQTQSSRRAGQIEPEDRRWWPSGVPAPSSLLGPGGTNQLRHVPGPCPHSGQTLSWWSPVQQKSE